MKAKEYAADAKKMIYALNTMNIDKVGSKMLNQLGTSKNHFEVKLANTGSSADALYSPKIGGGGTIQLSNKKSNYIELGLDAAHEFTHASQHEKLGSIFETSVTTTEWEGEAYDTQFGIYNRLKTTYGKLGVKYETATLYKSWKSYKNNRLTAFRRNYMKTIYNEYKKYGHPIKYIGP